VLVADPGEFTFDGSGDDGALRYVSLVPGFTLPLATGMPNPNFVVATSWGDVLVSDDTGETIYAIGYDAGKTDGVRPWLEGVPSPNGMGWAPDGEALYVVTTFTPDPPLWRVPVDGGVPGTPEVVTTLPTGAAPDGLAVDADGGVWVAANLDGEVVRVDPQSGEATAVGRGLDTPASLAFGAGDGFDPCSIYFTELFGTGVGRLAVGVEGAPVPVAPAPPDAGG
jgi:sugar lactone lactonase YvrE